MSKVAAFISENGELHIAIAQPQSKPVTAPVGDPLDFIEMAASQAGLDYTRRGAVIVVREPVED